MNPLFLQSPHRRWNALRHSWVLVSPHRTQRPWQGQVEQKVSASPITYDPTCYLCPGNVRASGKVTPEYRDTFVFENDYAALKPEIEDAEINVESAGLLHAQTERGICRVLCFNPRHDLTLATMELESIRRVIDVWALQETELSNLPEARSFRFGEGLTAEKMCECTWVKPEIVVQIDYTEWTEANHLRHSFFKGNRGRQACTRCGEGTWIKFPQQNPV